MKISCFIDGKNSWIDKRHMKFINKKEPTQFEVFLFFLQIQGQGTL